MSPANLTLTSLQAAVLRLAIAPTNGHNYSITNFNTGLCLEGSQVDEGIPVVESPCTHTLDQAWLYLTYPPSTDPLGPITLQVQSAPKIDGRGGYLRVNDTSINTIEAGGAPQAWKLIQPNPEVTLYKIMPYENVFSQDGTLVISDVDLNDPLSDQVQLHEDAGLNAQLWAFELLD